MTTETVSALVKSLLTMRIWNSTTILIMLLMFQDIHPNILYELLPHFQMSHRQVRNIILATIQFRLFCSSIFRDIVELKHLSYFIRKNPHHWVSRQFYIFRKRIFFNLLKKSRFDDTLKYTGHAVRDFISNFVVFRRSPIFPIGQLFSSQNSDLICLKTACEMIVLFEQMRSSYPQIVSFLAQNQGNVQRIILIWKTQMCIKEKSYYKSRKHCHVTYSGNITVHPIHEFFVFCILAITHPEFIDGRLMRYIQTFGDRTELPEDSCDPKYTDFFRKNCVTWTLQFVEFRSKSLISAFSRMYNSDGPHGVKYELNPTPATSSFYQKDDHQFECLTMEVERQYPMLRVFTTFLNLFLKNFARKFEESGGSALPP